MDHDLAGTKAYQIGSALEFYHQDFTQYLAAAISFSEKLPIEIDNQIRDAFTHLSRAHFATSIHDTISEVVKAKGHIERANRDCLKTAIILAREELEGIRANILLRHGVLSPVQESTYKQLKSMRKEAYLAETRGDVSVVKQLEEILRVTLALVDDFKDSHAEKTVKASALSNFFKRHSKIVAYGLFTLGGTAFGIIVRPYAGLIVDWILR